MRPRLLWPVLAVATLAYVWVVVMAAPSLTQSAASLTWLFMIVPVMTAAGAVIMWRRPENEIGSLLVLVGLAMFVLPTILEIPTLLAFDEAGVQPWMWAPMWGAKMLNVVGLVVACDLIVRLPDGRFRFDRERRFVRLAWLALLLPVLSLVSNGTVLTHPQAFPGLDAVPSPLVVDQLVPLGSVLSALESVSYGLFLIAVLLQFRRYRHAPISERKQVRWVLFAGVIATLVGVVPFLLEEFNAIEPLGHGSITAITSSLVMTLFPLSVVIAILEPSWVDVDIVIRKSLVYGVLSFIILLVYVAVAAALGVAAGARLDVEVAVLVTVVVAVLFQPARRRLQLVADHWVFGVRPTKYEALTGFGENLSQSTDPEELLSELVDTIRNTLSVTWVTARLDDGDRAAAGLETGDPVLEVEIGSEGEVVGVVKCGPKTNGTIDEDEKQLVRTLAGQAGLAVMNGRLAARIVTAAEAERRRIERNIHDGAQQELVALVARLGMARASAEGGEVDPAELASLQTEARQILVDLRELARGIHPSVLSDGGILEAVEERCGRLPLDVSIRASDGIRRQRFDDDVEGAAYFFITECLANVLKHADATRVSISVERAGGRLELGVADDGSGFDPGPIRHNGLAGLTDRLQALGGTVTIDSRPGEGTRILAFLPVD